MATLSQSPTGVYRLHFRFPPGRAGQQFTRSLDTVHEDEASELQAAVERTIRHVQEGVVSIPKDANSDDVWQLLRSGGKVAAVARASATVLLKEASKRYLAARQVDASTIRTERTQLKHFADVLGNVGMHTIKPASLREYISKRSKDDGLHGGRIKNDTIRKELATFSLLWQFAKSEGFVSGDNPYEKIELPKKSKPQRFRTWEEIEEDIARGGLTDLEQAELWDSLFLRPEEITAFLAHVQEESKKRRYPFIYPALAFCAYTGARRSEMFRCRISDVNGKIIIRERKRDTDTNETERIVPIHPKLAAIIEGWLADHPGGQFMFPKANGNQLEDRTSRDAWEAMTKGSKWEKLRGFHCLRHSFISILALRGRTQQEIKELAGHGTDEMYDRYCHLFPEKREEAIAALGF